MATKMSRGKGGVYSMDGNKNEKGGKESVYSMDGNENEKRGRVHTQW